MKAGNGDGTARPDPGPLLTRRSLLARAGRAGLAGAGALALGGTVLGACGGGSDSSSGGSATNRPGEGNTGNGDAADDVRLLMPFFADGEGGAPVLRPGVPQRMPWGVADGEGVPLAELPDELLMTITDQAGGRVGEPIVVRRHGDGTPYPYFPLRTELTQPGRYLVSLTLDDQPLQRHVVLAPADQVSLVQPGERAVPVMTPTVDEPGNVDPICTREPACPFHEITLGRALSSGRPTAFLISTPAFCQTAACGPVLELLIEEAAGRSLEVIHAEVYADAVRTGDPLRSTLSEATKAYKLSFEPSLVVADAHGIVVDRLDFVYDRTELRALLDRVS